MWWSHIVIGTCLQLIGVNLAIDAYGGLPFYNNGVDCSSGCTLSHMGGPIQVGEVCFLPVLMSDPYYSEYLDLWCQDTSIPGANGPVAVRTPCLGGTDVVLPADAPYDVRVAMSWSECPQWMRDIEFCSGNVCTAADKLAELCTCTAAEEPCP